MDDAHIIIIFILAIVGAFNGCENIKYQDQIKILKFQCEKWKDK